MATRSSIAVKLSPTTVKVIYCHWDGYLSNNGSILLEHYTTPELVHELISHGSLSSLGDRVNPSADAPHSYEHPQPDVCVYYGRDRGESDTDPTVVSIDEYPDHFQEFDYLYIDNRWVVGTCGVFFELDYAVAHAEEIYEALDEGITPDNAIATVASLAELFGSV